MLHEPAEEPTSFRDLLGRLSAAFEGLQAKQNELIVLNTQLAKENCHLRGAFSSHTPHQKDTSAIELDCNGTAEDLGPHPRPERTQSRANFAPEPELAILVDTPEKNGLLHPHEHWTSAGKVSHECNQSGSPGNQSAAISNDIHANSHSLPAHSQSNSSNALGGSGSEDPLAFNRTATSERHLQKRRTLGAIGQFEEKVFDHAESVRPMSLRAAVTGIAFDLTFAALILMNTMLMAFEAQYKGYDEGDVLRQQYGAEYQGNVLPEKPADKYWPNAQDYMDALEICFGAIFTFELVIKVVALRWDFARQVGNWFDAFIVLVWLIDQIVKAAMPLNPMLLRLMRLLRLVRIARMVKTIQAFDSLQVLIGSIIASVSVLFWSGILLLVVQMMVALFLHSMLGDYIGNNDNPYEARLQVYEFFGTFTRSMMTMFELTLGNWAPVSRCLIDNVSEWYGTLILIYKLIVGFAVVKVITGVFLHETFKVAATDDELMIVQKHRDRAKHIDKMKRLFKEADQDGNGVVSRDEFKALLANQKMSTWLAAMDVEPTLELFDLCDDGDGELTVTEVVEGISRLKGPARNIDVVALKRQIYDQAEDVEIPLSELRQSIEELKARLSANVNGGIASKSAPMGRPYSPSSSRSWSLLAQDAPCLQSVEEERRTRSVLERENVCDDTRKGLHRPSAMQL